MKLKNRAITALILSVILLGLAVLIWANQTGKITIWGAGGVVTVTPVTPEWQQKTTCDGHSVIVGLYRGSETSKISFSNAMIKCATVQVDGLVAVRTPTHEIGITARQNPNGGQAWKEMICPAGTVMYGYIPTSMGPAYPVNENTPAKILCGTLTTSTNWRVAPSGTATDVQFVEELGMGLGRASCSGISAATKFTNKSAPAGIGGLPFDMTLTCTGLTASGGPAPTTAPTTAPAPTTPQDVTPPSAPLNLTATALSQTEIDLKWTASTDNKGVAGYKIYNADTNELITTTTATTYKITGAKCGTIYRYFVVSFDAAGNHSNRSNVAEATTLQCDPSTDKEKPTAPSNLKYSNLNSSGTAPDCWSVDLAWNASTDNVGVTGYDIYNAETNKIITSTDKTNFKLSGLNENSTFKYYIKARDAAGNISDTSNTIELKTGSCPKPSPSPSQNIANLVRTGGALWFNILVAILISGIATFFLLKKNIIK